MSILYTVVPLERIYVDHKAKELEIKQSVKEANYEYKDVQLKHGRVVARRDGDNYVVQKINSTDMSDYLKDEYTPGKTIQ
ncbi:hypothetical protein I5677_15375 [Mobilitalea sibirica]|uniref:Uncharacterized protein n=1 Tax=Mobilitalea sibirica TaxID=1462919 RepID=A0A8J7HCN9_9FIRM|nr:YlzJ-like family protein [Mobilitalea sibirica]MBH1942281.1 hypothetical protein [Mobilitalea sibirica]